MIAEQHSNPNEAPEGPCARPAGLPDEVARLRAALQDIADTAERYNYVGWQRIVGVMQRRALQALRESNEKRPRDGACLCGTQGGLFAVPTGATIDTVAIKYIHNLCLLVIRALEKTSAPQSVIDAIATNGDIQPAHDWLMATAPNVQGER